MKTTLTLLIGVFWLTSCGTPYDASKESTPIAASPTTIPGSLVPSPSPLSYSPPSAHIRFERIDVPDGLSQSVVTCILQDRQGFIWIGTQDGLNRFDGNTFKIFRPSSDAFSSINDRWINTLFQDDQGALWIGTRLGGLNRYDPATGKFTYFTHDVENVSSLISNQIQVVFEDSRGRLWVGTAEGLERYSPAGNSFEHINFNVLPSSELSSDNITSIYEDSSKSLWIGTAYAGLNRFDESSGEFINYSMNSEEPFKLTSNAIRSIQEDSNGTLWVGTDNGLNLIYPETGTVTHFQHAARNPATLAGNSVKVIFIDQQGFVWVGTNLGLDRYDYTSRSFIHYNNDPGMQDSLSSNNISAINQSSDGVIWIGTSGSGLNKYYRGQDRFKYFRYNATDPEGLSGNVVRDINIDDNGNVWIATLDGGLDRLTLRNGSVTRYLHDPDLPTSLASNEVWSVLTDSNGTLWVGTSAGLDMLAPGTSEFVHYSHIPGDQGSLVGAPVYYILESDPLNLWLGTEYGLELFDRIHKTFTHFQNDPEDAYSISGNVIETIYKDRSGIIWIGTFNEGLNRYNTETGQFARYVHDPADPQSLSNNSILSIFQDSRGTLWIGTDGGGLNRLNIATGGFDHFGESRGLPNNVIYGIEEDEQGFLWLSTNHGISRFDPQSGISIRNYTVTDGLQGNEFSPSAVAKDGDGFLYFGGVNGLTVFNPALISDSPFIPTVVLLSITQDGMPLYSDTAPEMLQEITLKWPLNGFEFEYAALSYAQPGKNQYAYILENFDADWQQVGERHDGRYTNLPGGDYLLRIKASNQDGVWNETGISIRILVVPPFWQTVWFRVTLIAGSITLALSAYWLRIKGIQANNRELERQVRDRTQEIEKLFEKTKELAVVEERNRLARELHDSAKQKAFAALAQLGTANGIVKKDPRAAKSHLDEAENLVYQVIEELTFLIQEMYPVTLKERGLAATLREYVFEWENRTDIQAKLHIENDRRLRLDIEQSIFRVIQEALSNVSRHSRADKVEVVLSYKADTLMVKIADNGCGFDPQEKPTGVGLRSIRERIESLSGTVKIDTLPDCGTSLTVELPIG